MAEKEMVNNCERDNRVQNLQLFFCDAWRKRTTLHVTIHLNVEYHPLSQPKALLAIINFFFIILVLCCSGPIFTFTLLY